MFIGSYDHTFDAKGRVSIPAKYRTGAEGEKFFVAKGTTDRCLFVYPEDEWYKMWEKLNALPIITNRKAADFVRNFSANAHECEVDKLGRINIPSELREYAGILKNAKIVGVRDRFEIWNLESWKDKQADTEFENMQATMEELDFEF